MIRGWVHGLIHSTLNGPNATTLVNVGQVCVYIWDGKINNKSRVLYHNMGNTGQEYTVWIVDCAKKHAITGRGREDGYTVHYWARNRTFGGSGHWDTLDEAKAHYDDLRGAVPDQLSLL
jgi:hypothetical protein